MKMFGMHRLLQRIEMARGKSAHAAAAKPPAAKPPAGSASAASTQKRPTAASTPIALPESVSKLAWPLFIVVAAVVLLRHILPMLAELTPPGVDLQAVHRLAEQKVLSESHGCKDPNVCKGMGCPSGWTTGLAPNDPCKCICVRLQAITPWDEERKKKEAEKASLSAGQQQQAQQSQQQQQSQEQQPGGDPSGAAAPSHHAIPEQGREAAAEGTESS